MHSIVRGTGTPKGHMRAGGTIVLEKTKSPLVFEALEEGAWFELGKGLVESSETNGLIQTVLEEASTSVLEESNLSIRS